MVSSNSLVIPLLSVVCHVTSSSTSISQIACLCLAAALLLSGSSAVWCDVNADVAKNEALTDVAASPSRQLLGLPCQTLGTCTYTIFGKVVDGAGATVSITGSGVSKTAVASATGDYVVQTVPNGEYTVQPATQQGYTFTPGSVTVRVANADATAPSITRLVPAPPPPTFAELVPGEEPPPVFAASIEGIGDELTSLDTFTPDLSFDETVAQDIDGSFSTENEAFRLSESMGNEIDTDWSDFLDTFDAAPNTDVYQPSRKIVLGPDSFACDSPQPTMAQLLPISDPAPTGNSPGVLVQEISGYHSLKMTERVRAIAIHVSGIVWNAAGSTAKLSVRVQYADGSFVRSSDPRFRDLQGYLCSSISVPVSAGRTMFQGLVYLPYTAFDLSGSVRNLEAVSTLQVGSAYATNGGYSFDLQREVVRYQPPATTGFGELKTPVPASLVGGAGIGGVAVYAINGYGGCCVPDKIVDALRTSTNEFVTIGNVRLRGLGVGTGNVKVGNWNNLNKAGKGGFGKGKGFGPDDDVEMRIELENEMVTTTPGTVAIFIGHSFGGDSLLKVAKCLDQIDDIAKKIGSPNACPFGPECWCVSDTSSSIYTTIGKPGYFRRRVVGIYLLDSVQGREGPSASVDSNAPLKYFDTRQQKSIPKQVLVAFNRMTPYPSTLGTFTGGSVSIEENKTTPTTTAVATAAATVASSSLDTSAGRALLARELLFGIKVRIPSCCPKVRKAVGQLGTQFKQGVVQEYKSVARKVGGYLGKVGSEILKNNLVFGIQKAIAIKAISYTCDEIGRGTGIAAKFRCLSVPSNPGAAGILSCDKAVDPTNYLYGPFNGTLCTDQYKTNGRARNADGSDKLRTCGALELGCAGFSVPSNCGQVILSGFKRGCRNKGSMGWKPLEMTHGTIPNDAYIQVEMYRSLSLLVSCLNTNGADAQSCSSFFSGK